MMLALAIVATALLSSQLCTAMPAYPIGDSGSNQSSVAVKASNATVESENDCAHPSKRPHVQDISDSCKSEFVHEGFKKTNRNSNIPQPRPFRYKNHGLDWVNFAKLDAVKILGPGKVDLAKGHTEVAAIGGRVDNYGTTLSRPVGFIGMQPGSDVQYWDLSWFDFFCMDKKRQATACEIGVQTSSDRDFNAKASLTSSSMFKFEPSLDGNGNPTARQTPKRASVQAPGIKIAAIGIPIAGLENDKFYNNQTQWMDDDSLASEKTLYIDHVHLNVYHCHHIKVNSEASDDGIMRRALAFPSMDSPIPKDGRPGMSEPNF